METCNTNTSLPLPPDFETMSPDEKRDVIAYLNTLDEVEVIAYAIAIEQLGSSFDLLRSNGFCDWKKEQERYAKPPSTSASS